MGTRLKRPRRLSSWRRIALHAWDDPRDPSVYSILNLNIRRTLSYLEQCSTVAPGVSVTVTHVVVKAIATALAAHPQCNGLIARRRVFLRENADVYCQVATDGGRDLSGLKICRADAKSVVDIAQELAVGAAAVKRHEDPASGATIRLVTLMPHALLRPFLRLVGYLTYGFGLDLSRLGIAYDQFGGAMVSNVGMFGADNALAPLVPPTRAPIVLLIGAIEDRPVVEDGRVAVAPCITIGGTFDHRLFDGFQAAAMYRIVKRAVEDPFSAFGLPERPSSIGALANRPDENDRDPSGIGCKDRRPGFLREEDRGQEVSRPARREDPG